MKRPDPFNLSPYSNLLKEGFGTRVSEFSLGNAPVDDEVKQAHANHIKTAYGQWTTIGTEHGEGASFTTLKRNSEYGTVKTHKKLDGSIHHEFVPD